MAEQYKSNAVKSSIKNFVIPKRLQLLSIYGTQNDSLTHDDIVSRLKPLGKIKDEIRGGSGYSMLEPQSAREAALEWLLNGNKVEKV